MNEDKFWIVIWTLAAGLVLILAFCATFNSYINNQSIERMVADGSDPLVASCAILGDYRSPMCMVIAARK
jgi:hypothetical protein